MGRYAEIVTNNKKTTGKILAAAAVIACLILIVSSNRQKIKRLENEIFLLPSQSYEADELDGLKARLEAWEIEPISDPAKAVLYGRLSYIASQKGDWLEYYTNYGKEQYYLEAGNDYEAEINSCCDILFYTYLAEGNIELAKATLDKIDGLIEEHGLDNQQLLSMVNRHHSAISYYEDSYDDAADFAAKAVEVMTDTAPSYYEAYEMGADMLKAKALCGKGDFASAQELLDKYKDSSLFSATFYPSTLYNVCLIPYYQTMVYVSASRSDEAAVLEYIDKVVRYSIEYDYEYYGFDTLDRVESMANLTDSATETMHTLEKDLTNSFIFRRSERFSGMCAAVVESNYEAARIHEADRTKDKRLIVSLVVFLLSVMVFAIIIRIVTRNGNTDSLTGIGNRKAFDRTVASLDAKRQEYSIIMMDIDDFKRINDTFGHDEGDRVLQGIGKILRAIYKKGQVLPFRYGGEEFVVLTHGLLVDGSSGLAEMIRSEIERQKICGHNITVSIGLAYSRRENEEERETALKLADKNMYEAKKNGKNCIVSG